MTIAVANVPEPGLWVPPHAKQSRIKWYDPQRRFGFIAPPDGGGDIWFNWLTLMRNNIVETVEKPDKTRVCVIMPDMPVTFTFEQPDVPSKQRSVVYMRLDI